MPENTLLEVEGAVAGYLTDIAVLQGLDFQASGGQLTAVIGPNGAGKSTLLKAIAGFLPLRAGRIWYRGLDITRHSPEDLLAAGIAYVPQDRSLFPELTVEENLELGCWIFRRDQRRVAEALGRVYSHFPVFEQKRLSLAGTLSGGEQRILEVARALMPGPSVLLLDEPTAMMAPIVARQIYDSLAALKAEGITVVLVEQNVKKAVEVADYVYVLEMGQVRVHGDRPAITGRMGDIIRGWITVDELAPGTGVTRRGNGGPR